jgi:ATPase family associated with various cellular activities (AAA)
MVRQGEQRPAEFQGKNTKDTAIPERLDHMLGTAHDEIARMIDDASASYYRLILVVGPAGSGKTRVLRAVAEGTGLPCITVSLELSQCLLDVPEQRRPLRALEVLSDIVGKAESAVVLLDDTELLFDASLKLEPLHCLQRISRQKTVVATWNGALQNGRLVYAVPGHPEYRQYPAGDLMVVNLGATA